MESTTVLYFSLLGGLYHKTLGYYGNFIAFLFHQKTIENYYGFFDSNTPNDYELADIINLHKSSADQIFLWGNNAQVYKLTNTLPPGRYIVAYHITSSQETAKETAKALQNAKPKYVIVSLKIPFPYALEKYKPSYVVGSFMIYERLF